MANKSEMIRESVTSGSQTVKTFGIIPNGEIWTVKIFGGADINLGDNKSSVYVMQWGDASGGWTDIRVISCTGTTYELYINRSFTGNGTKRFRVIMQNKSGHTKDLAFWYDAYSR